MSHLAAVSLIIDGVYFHFVYRCAEPQPSAFGNCLVRDMARVLQRDFNNDIEALTAHVRERYSAARPALTPKRPRALCFRAIIDRTVASKAVPANWQYVIDLDGPYFYVMDYAKTPLGAVTRGLEFTLDDDRAPDPEVVVPVDYAPEAPPAAETFAAEPRWTSAPVWETVPTPCEADVRRMLGRPVADDVDVIAVAVSDGTDRAFIPVARYMTWNNVMNRARQAVYQMPTFRQHVLQHYKVRVGLFSATPRLAYQGVGARMIDVSSPKAGAPFAVLVPGCVLYATLVYLADYNVWWAPFGRAGPHCAQCGTSAGPDLRLRACSGCLHTYYCSAECQRTHWRQGGHKNECAKC